MAETVLCPKCGHDLPPDWETCPVCGLSRIVICPVCRKETPLAETCEHCGYRLEIRCPNEFCRAERRSCLKCRGSFPPEP